MWAVSVGRHTAALLSVACVMPVAAHSEDHTKTVEPSSKWDKNWDFREPITAATLTGQDISAEPPKKKRVRHQIVLIRHGQYEPGGTDADRILTPLGREQATCAGKRLRELVDAKQIKPIKYVFYSPMQRASETHALIQPHLPPSILPHHVKPCSMIMEGAVCRPSPKHDSWNPTDEEFIKDGARVHAAFLHHVHRAADDEDQSYSTILVCHGNVIRYFAMRALQLPTDAWLRTSVANASMTILDISPSGSVSMRCLGESGFLSAQNVTFN